MTDLHNLRNRMNSVLTGLKISGACEYVDVHRHFAYFDVRLEPGEAIRKIETKVREIALGIESKTTPIVTLRSELGLVRLQVALRSPEMIRLESLYSEYTCPSIREMALPFILGESDDGNKLIVDFAKNPHTLIAGGTGSGKSVLLHCLIANIAYLNEMRARNIELYLVDPKQVEFNRYESDTFSNFVCDVISDYERVVGLLENLESIMESRYAFMAKGGFRSLEDCPGLFSHIVVIIDEVGDLMLQDKKSSRFEKSLIRLAQKARAAGIHLIMATQRPSVDVITGLIKANFPARIACKTSSRTDSQVILDAPGAETLLGRGDAVIKDGPRFQAAFSSPEHTENTCLYFRNLNANN